MKVTKFVIGPAHITVVDPENPRQREILEQAVIEFYRDVERAEARKERERQKNNANKNIVTSV